MIIFSVVFLGQIGLLLLNNWQQCVYIGNATSFEHSYLWNQNYIIEMSWWDRVKLL